MQLVLERRAERSTLIAVASPLAVALTIGTFAILFAIMGKNPLLALWPVEGEHPGVRGRGVHQTHMHRARYHPVRMICANPSASLRSVLLSCMRSTALACRASRHPSAPMFQILAM
jgi:hypothetical protein